MKKFFVMAALVGVALTSCMKNEVYVPTCDAPISFEVANYEAQTRAGAFEGTSFGVNAWSYNGTAAHQLMTNVEVSYDGTKWTTEDPYYWPINGTVDFIAYYPTNVVPNIDYKYDGTDTYTYENYIVGEDDLMYADEAIQFSANNTATGNDTALDYTVGDYGFEGVPTLFHHALAKVNFKVKNANPEDGAFKYEIIVNSITLNVYKQGTLVLTNNGATPASRSTWTLPTGNVWTPTGSLETLTPWTDSTVLDDDSVVAYAPSRTQYVLPQTLEDGKQTITIDYTVIQKQGATEISRKHYDPVTKDLNDLDLPSWQMNKNITYTISISKESAQILFAPAVEEWGSAAGDDAITVQ